MIFVSLMRSPRSIHSNLYFFCNVAELKARVSSGTSSTLCGLPLSVAAGFQLPPPLRPSKAMLAAKGVLLDVLIGVDDEYLFVDSLGDDAGEELNGEGWLIDEKVQRT